MRRYSTAPVQRWLHKRQSSTLGRTTAGGRLYAAGGGAGSLPDARVMESRAAPGSSQPSRMPPLAETQALESQHFMPFRTLRRSSMWPRVGGDLPADTYKLQKSDMGKYPAKSLNALRACIKRPSRPAPRFVALLLECLKCFLLASAALLLFTVAMLAGWAPAQRASSIQPLQALRHE